MENLEQALAESLAGEASEETQSTDDIAGEAFLEEEPQTTARPENPAGEEEEAAFLVEEGAHPENGETAAPDEQMFTLKYNGEEKQLPAHEVRTLAQKGMNYDKMLARLQEAQNSPEARVLDEWARDAGMDRRQYMEYLQGARQEKFVKKLMQGKGYSEEAARSVWQLQQENTRLQNQQAKTRQQAAEAERYMPLARKYPSLKELPPEVGQAIREGVAPLRAYENYLQTRKLADMEQKLGGHTAAAKNRQSLPGSAAGWGSPEVRDPFLQGFWD